MVVEERPHAGIELVFTPKEEIGLLGATELDVSQLRARAGFVYDQAAPIGEVVVGAPSAQELVMRFHGRPAHAGMYPEEGRSAVLAAARAIVDMPLGRIDDNTSANVGLIDGGSARNVVPEWCKLQAEVALARPCAGERGRPATARRGRLRGGGLGLHARDAIEPKYRGYRLARRRCRCGSRATALGGRLRAAARLSGGAADANVFNERGLPCVNLANGMVDIHTPDERIAVEDLERMVEVTLGIVDAAQRRSTLMPLGLRWGRQRGRRAPRRRSSGSRSTGGRASPIRG